MVTVPCLGQTLTLYRQGLRFALFVGLATLALFNLPWHHIPIAGQVLPPLTAAIGCYLAATLIAWRAPAEAGPDAASGRWL